LLEADPLIDQDVDFLYNIITVSVTAECSERATFHEHQGSHCKIDDSMDRGIEKWFSGFMNV
jgi:hypothetical protein